MGYVPSRPPPPRKPVMPSNVSAETGLPVSLPWNTGLHPLLHTPTPGAYVDTRLSFSEACQVARSVANGGYAVLPETSSLEFVSAPSMRCRYCRRIRTTAATCEGCGAPR